MRDSTRNVNSFSSRSLILLSLFLILLVSFSFFFCPSVSALEVLGNQTIYSTGITEGVIIINTTAINISTIAHNSLAGLQGGSSGEYYHLNLSAFSKIITDLYNFITGTDTPKYLSTNGSNVSFNETALNNTISQIGNDTYVPYNGSTQNVNLDGHNLTAEYVNANMTWGYIQDVPQSVYDQKDGAAPYLYNNTTSIILNETKLNETILQLIIQLAKQI